jgi:hypothetical protein
MKNFLALIIVSFFAVSCYQDDDMEFQNEATFADRQSEDEFQSLSSAVSLYEEPTMGEDNGDDPPPKQIGGNGARPAPGDGTKSK